MTLIMYERIGLEERRPSPFSWRIRYALAHKDVAVEYRPVRFADVETIRALSGQDKVPVLVHRDRVIYDFLEHRALPGNPVPGSPVLVRRRNWMRAGPVY